MVIPYKTTLVQNLQIYKNDYVNPDLRGLLKSRLKFNFFIENIRATNGWLTVLQNTL